MGADDRLAKLEANAALLMALVRTLSDRVAELEGCDGPALPDAVTTIKSAAFTTGFSQSTIRMWVAQGKIVARKIGGAVLIDAASLPPRRCEKKA